MHFLRLLDPLLSILFEDDEIIAIDKPYGVNSHTNDAKAGNEDFIHDGLIEIFEKQLAMKLHIVHRLDRTTTGVIIFAKTEPARKKYADAFRGREVKKTYVFVTKQSTSRDSFSINDPIEHKGKSLEASTDFKKQKSANGFELWQASPHTGRNHQIRIHAKAAGISLLGDQLYGGASYPFICLHNRRIEFPNGLVLESRMPKYFEDLQILRQSEFAQVLFEIDRRERLYPAAFHPGSTQSLRLIHEKTNGFTLDKFGDALLLSLYKETWRPEDQRAFDFVANSFGLPVYVRQMVNRGKDPSQKSEFVIGSAKETQEWVAIENKLKFETRSSSGVSFGLFFDQRSQRQWVRENSRAKHVLNLYAYTCLFSVAAAVGEAASVTSVDTNKNVLNWGRQNFAFNGLEPEASKFLCRDSQTFLEQCKNKGIKFDIVICDPPSFSRGEKGVFKIEANLEKLIQSCLQVLEPGGTLLFSTNSENLFTDDVRRAIEKVLKSLKLERARVDSLQAALDYELPEQKTILKSFMIRS